MPTIFALSRSISARAFMQTAYSRMSVPAFTRKTAYASCETSGGTLGSYNIVVRLSFEHAITYAVKYIVKIMYNAKRVPCAYRGTLLFLNISISSRTPDEAAATPQNSSAMLLPHTLPRLTQSLPRPIANESLFPMKHHTAIRTYTP